MVPATLPCLNPECSVACIWRSKGVGRQPRFCSDVCRMAFSRGRASWLATLAQAEHALAVPGLSTAETTELRRLATAARWVLDRYRPPVDHS